jgi:predicted TIM-barrel fold metal-dependent hydrolase
VKDAADLREAKNAIITSLMRQNTAWRKDYNERDFDKTLRTVEAFSKIAPVVVKADPGRTDMKTMLLYLQGRQYFVEELRRRDAAGGSADITAKSNQDLAQLWDTVTARLREMDLHFDDIFSRHLENDNLRPMIGVGDGR